MGFFKKLIEALRKTKGAEPELGQQPAGDGQHGECCDDCKRTCKRNFWTEVLKTVTKVAGVILAAMGLQSFEEDY